MPSNPEKRREQQRARRGFKSDEAPRSVKPRDEAPRKGANFPKRCPVCGYAHERHCSPELIAMFRERLADGRDLIDAETVEMNRLTLSRAGEEHAKAAYRKYAEARAVLRAHVAR